MPLLRQTTADNLQIAVFESRREMGRAAAKAAAECLRGLLKQKKELTVIFAAAPSQNETLEFLTLEQGIDWSRIHAFHMDEYVGLIPDAPQTFNAYLDEHIFGKVPFASVNRLQGWAKDTDAECGRYGRLLKNRTVDAVLLGIGENGHIAFNDPAVADFSDPFTVKEVRLDDICRMQQVHDGCFPSLDLVPRSALTLTIPCLMSASHLFCTVPGAAKRNAVTSTVRGEISASVPATAMRLHPDARMFCDAASGADLIGE